MLQELGLLRLDESGPGIPLCTFHAQGDARPAQGSLSWLLVSCHWMHHHRDHSLQTPCCSAVVAIVGAAVAANFKRLWWFDPVSWPPWVLPCQALSQRRMSHLSPCGLALLPPAFMLYNAHAPQTCKPPVPSAGPCHHNLRIHHIFLGQDLQGPGGSLWCESSGCSKQGAA